MACGWIGFSKFASECASAPPSSFIQPIVFKLIYRKFGNRIHAKDDLLSGLTVALALVPEAVAFAIIAGVSPIIGLYAAS